MCITFMQMNSRSIQDLQIFKDPRRIPIIIIERVVNTPLPSTTGISYLENTNINNNQQKSRGLRMAVFVHGFQACMLEYIINFGVKNLIYRNDCFLNEK